MKTIISNLLKENTGVHFLDSGGSDGRAWQKNQNIDFEQERAVTLDDGYFTVSLYHYLMEMLSIDTVTDSINAYLRENDIHWVNGVDLDFVAIELDLPYLDNESEVFNTYNWDSNFSQDFIFQTFTIDGENYCLLQVHNGADIRGGYTDVQCFKIPNEFFGHVDVWGSINGVQVSTYEDGKNLTDEDGVKVEWDLESVQYDLNMECLDV